MEYMGLCINPFIISDIFVAIVLLVDCSPPLFLVLLKLSQAFIFASVLYKHTRTQQLGDVVSATHCAEAEATLAMAL